MYIFIHFPYVYFNPSEISELLSLEYTAHSVTVSTVGFSRGHVPTLICATKYQVVCRHL